MLMLDIILVKCRCYTEYKPVLFEKKIDQDNTINVVPGLSCELPKNYAQQEKIVR